MKQKSVVIIENGKLTGVGVDIKALELFLEVIVGEGAYYTDCKIDDKSVTLMSRDLLVSKRRKLSIQIDMQPVSFRAKCPDGMRSMFRYNELQLFLDTGMIHGKGWMSDMLDDNDNVVAKGFHIDNVLSIRELLKNDKYQFLDAIKKSRMIM